MQRINDRYEFNPKTDELGKGGFGRVFKARDTLLERDVVLKYAEKGNLPEKYSLVKEISRVIDFSHPNLVRYYDAIVKKATNSFGEEVEYQIGVMEYVRDGNLRAYIDNEPKETEIFQIVEGVLNGLSYLHGRNLIHRDIKPPNILLNREGNIITPKICDFGISKISGSEATTLSNVIGTFEYMSPEQLGSNPGQKIKTNSDLWAMGILIYEMFFRDLPFGSRRSGTTDAQIVGNILSKGIPDRVSEIPQPFRDVIEACLIKDPDTRPNHAKELLEILKSEKKTSLPITELPVDTEEVEEVKETPPIANTLIPDIPSQKDNQVLEFHEDIIEPIQEKSSVSDESKITEQKKEQKNFNAVVQPKSRKIPILSVLWLIASPFFIFFIINFFEEENIAFFSINEGGSGVLFGSLISLLVGLIVYQKHEKPISGAWPGLYMLGFSMLIELVCIIIDVGFFHLMENYDPGLLTLTLSLIFLARNHRKLPSASIVISAITAFLSMIFPVSFLRNLDEKGFLFLAFILFLTILITCFILVRKKAMSKIVWSGLFSLLTIFIFSIIATKSADRDYGCYPLDMDCMGHLWTICLVALVIVLLIVNANKKLTNSPLA